jgi:hypothetical protein
MNWCSGDLCSIKKRSTGEENDYYVLGLTDAHAIYCDAHARVCIRALDDFKARASYMDAEMSMTWETGKDLLDLDRHDNSGVRVIGTYGFHLNGEFKCLDRNQWISCVASYNKHTRQWSIDTFDGAMQ